jgi:hypothetical protein
MRPRRHDVLGLVAVGILILLFILARSWRFIRWGWR